MTATSKPERCLCCNYKLPGDREWFCSERCGDEWVEEKATAAQKREILDWPCHLRRVTIRADRDDRWLGDWIVDEFTFQSLAECLEGQVLPGLGPVPKIDLTEGGPWPYTRVWCEGHATPLLRLYWGEDVDADVPGARREINGRTFVMAVPWSKSCQRIGPVTA